MQDNEDLIKQDIKMLRGVDGLHIYLASTESYMVAKAILMVQLSGNPGEDIHFRMHLG